MKTFVMCYPLSTRVECWYCTVTKSGRFIILLDMYRSKWLGEEPRVGTFEGLRIPSHVPRKHTPSVLLTARGCLFRGIP